MARERSRRDVATTMPLLTKAKLCEQAERSFIVFCDLIVLASTQRTRGEVSLYRGRTWRRPLLSLARTRLTVVSARTIIMALLLIMAPRRLLALFLARARVF